MNIKTLLVLITVYIPVLGLCLSPKKCMDAKYHLMEINSEWGNYIDQFQSDLDYPINFESDDERIQFHLNHVYAYLINANSTESTHQKELRRMDILNELLDYASANEFPRNKNHQKRQPYFVDEDNRHCAVAHLLRYDEQPALLNQIKEKKNNHFIKEMKIESLLKWAEKNGFTENELALIQPGYPSQGLVWTKWGNENGIDGSVNVMKTSAQGSLLVLAGNFSSVDGVSANNIIAWNGDNWITLGNGVDGTINDLLSLEDGTLIIGGDFVINNVKSNVAYWDINQEWTSLVESMNGSINCLELWNDQLYIGGSFSEVNNLEVNNLAFYNFDNEVWSIDSSNGIESSFSADNTVYDFEISNSDSLIVVGSFEKTGVLSDDPNINSDSCTYLSFWDGDNWDHKLQGEYSEVHHIDIFEGLYTIVGDPSKNNCVATFGNPDLGWEYHYDTLDWAEFAFDDMSEFNGITDGFIFGDFDYINFNITQNYKSYSSQNGINGIDGSITAIENFQGQQYIVGNFAQIQGSDFNGFAKTDGTLPSQEIDVLDLKVYSSFNHLYIEGQLEEQGQLQILNELGQVVIRKSIDKNLGNSQIDMSALNSGIYFYQLQVGQHKISDRIVHVGR